MCVHPFNSILFSDDAIVYGEIYNNNVMMSRVLFLVLGFIFKILPVKPLPELHMIEFRMSAVMDYDEYYSENYLQLTAPIPGIIQQNHTVRQHCISNYNHTYCSHRNSLMFFVCT